MFSFVNSNIDENLSVNCVVVCATRGYINTANLWWSGSRCILQHNEVYEINAFFS